MKKRVVTFALSIVVLVVCFVIYTFQTASLVAGVGNGDNEPLEDAEELSDFLEFVAERDASNIGGSYRLLSASIDSVKSENGKKKRRNKYESATISISTYISANSSSSNSELTGGLRSSAQNVSRRLDIYITEDETYYASKGVYSLIKEHSSGTITEVMNCDAEIFLKEDEVYIVFHDFIYAKESISEYEGETTTYRISRRIRPSMVDQWVEVSPVIASEILNIDADNRDTMDLFREFIDFLDACDALEETGITDLNQDEIGDIYEEWLEELPEEEQEEYDETIFDDDQKVKFTLDLSNPTNPYISFVDTMNSEKNNEVTTGYDQELNPITTHVTVTNIYKRVQEIDIRNVNNTIIDMDEDRASVYIDEDDEKDLFIVKEKKDD